MALLDYCGLLLPKGRKLTNCMNCAHELERKEEKITPDFAPPHSVDPIDDDKDSDCMFLFFSSYCSSSFDSGDQKWSSA
jgi:hypothetical protein